MPNLTPETMWRAVAASDPRYDGIFCYGVKTTGIFCRPSCKSRRPRHENTLFFPDAAAALAQGYRPCKRCRPDLAAAPDPATVQAACRLIESEYHDPAILADLPQRIGLSRSHLARLFKRHTGLTLRQYLHAVRIEKAQRLLLAGPLSGTSIAYEVGFNTPSRFFAAFRAGTGSSPLQWRRQRRPADA
jgi:AraC family transcriptional regulator of adaptative response / methylphosphotriester-DNA alkyltransferase methyltransferase